jgi:hypothetical protein
LGEVEGTVTLDKKPLGGVFVQFVPEAEKAGAAIPSTATSDVAGRFVLTWDKGGLPGAAVGKHRVLVTDPNAGGGDPNEDALNPSASKGKVRATSRNPPIPQAYSELRATPLRLEVRAGKQVIELPLKSR